MSDENTQEIIEEVVSDVSQDDKNMGLLLWLGTLFFGFIPSLVFYLVKKDNAYLLEHTKEALNWSITAAIGYFAGVILSFVFIGLLLFPVIGICHLVFCIMGMLAAKDGKAFTVPFAIRLIK